MHFLLVEVALRGFDIGGKAESLYDQGITTSFNE